MNSAFDTILVLVALTNLILVGTSRIAHCIRTVGAQGILLGLATLAAHRNGFSVHNYIIALGSIALKGFVFPWLMTRAMREADVRREVEPFIDFAMSILFAILALVGSLWVASKLQLPHAAPSALLLPFALFGIWTGLFLIVARRKAITQVIGFLVLENGIFTFGMTMLHEAPFLVEMGILLDVFVAVFVMGIAIFHIQREFDHIDADRLTILKDWHK